MSKRKRQAAGKAAVRNTNGDKGRPRADAGRRYDDRGGEGLPVSTEERRRMVAEAAYFRAAQRDFTPGGEFEDWVEAEAEVERLLSGDTSGTDRPEATRR